MGRRRGFRVWLPVLEEVSHQEVLPRSELLMFARQSGFLFRVGLAGAILRGSDVYRLTKC